MLFLLHTTIDSTLACLLSSLSIIKSRICVANPEDGEGYSKISIMPCKCSLSGAHGAITS
eukprot:3253201-Amphidinium_carterae.1